MPNEGGSIVELIRNNGTGRKVNTYVEHGIPGGGGTIGYGNQLIRCLCKGESLSSTS
jgi:hypothetical protein